MKPSVEKILTKLSQEKQKQSLQKIEKIELAKKPSTILKELDKLDNSIAREEQKIDKAYLQYKKVYSDWDVFTDTSEKQIIKITQDFGMIVKSLNELDVRPQSVLEMVKSDELIRRLTQVISNMKSLYKEPK